MRKPIYHLLVKEPPVWQVCERVMQGHMRNLGFRLSALGNVFVGHDPSAIRHRLINDRNFALIRRFHDVRSFFAQRQLGQKRGPILLEIAKQMASLGAVLKEFGQRAAWFHDGAREIVHLYVLVVANKDPLVLVEHEEALRHIVECRIESGVLLLQIVLTAFQSANRLAEDPQRENTDGKEHSETENTAQSCDDAAVDQQISRAGHDFDPANSRALDENRRPLRYCGISGSRADLNDELACGIKNALLVTAIISFRQFDQFRQTHALVLPKCIVDVDIFREPVGLQMRFELQVC